MSCYQIAAEIAGYQGITLGTLQKVEIGMFKKKYSPVVIGKASMFAFHLMDGGVRYVLQNEMIRFLHLTIDETRDLTLEGSCLYKSEFSGAVLCHNDKMILIEAEIILRKRIDGEWIISSEINSDNIRFPGCNALKGCMVRFVRANPVNIEFGEIVQTNVVSKKFYSPDDKALSEVREKILAN